MTAPTLVKRRLTVNFQRSVESGKPQVMEVAIAPLTSPSAPNSDATMVGGPQSQDILLFNEVNPAYFDLVPTDAAGLTDRLLYRIAWRHKYMGQQFTKDFVMPDFDVDFDDLEDLGNVIGGETYVQWGDRSRPGGIAGLNEAGQVVDSDGNPVTGAESAAVVQGNLEAEAVARQQGDQFLRTYFLQFATDQITAVYTTTANNLTYEVMQLQNADLIERSARENADNAIRDLLTNHDLDNDITFGAIREDITGINATLGSKADLVNGKIPSDQMPALAVGNAVPVSSKAEMLALTTNQVQQGDIAVITAGPDQGNYILNGSDPSVFGNWVKLSSGGAVQSVNNQTGAVNLSAANVGARALADPVPQGDVTGLLNALNAKTDTSVTAGIHQRLTTVENDATIVRTTAGTIAHAVHGNDVAFLNAQGQIVNKTGQVMNIGGAGGILDIEDVTGLALALDGKVDKTDPAQTNARPPTPHAANHSTTGSDPLTPSQIGARALSIPVPQADVSGLAEMVANNNLSVNSNFGNRINALEAVGGGGGGATSPVKSAWWDTPTPITGVPDVADLAEFVPVMLKSPFGKNSVDGTLYYDPAGAAEAEAVYPYVSPNGHLCLVARNENNPPDKLPATADELMSLTALVGTKANQVDLVSTNATVATKADQSSLASTNATVALKADQSAVAVLSNTVANKADQSALDTTNATVATKASQSALDALTTTVGTKADTSALNTTNASVTALQANKANLVSGTVPLAELPNSIPTNKIATLDNQLTAINNTVATKANQSALDGTIATLSTKADLVGGMVPTSQLPALAYNNTVVVPTKAAMLGLTPTQVQPGDVCVISGGVDQGSYILNDPNPAVFGNWVLLASPGGTGVTSVNGQPGPAVVLSSTDVGARSSSTPVPMTEVANLTTSLGNKADTSYVNTQLATKPTFAEVDTRISQSTNNKLPAGLVATTAIASLSGQQSIDGVLAPLGTIVLVTAQPSSVNNGLYSVASGSWARINDMLTGDYFIKGTQVVVTGGVTHHDSFWQETSTSGTVGTNPNNWVKTVTAGAPAVYTASLGVKKVGNDFQASVVVGGGIQAVAGGLQIDPTVGVRKVPLDVPAGSTIVTLTHNLNTTDVGAWFRDKAAGDAVLLGWKPISVNAISAEFDAPPAAGQWRAVIMG